MLRMPSHPGPVEQVFLNRPLAGYYSWYGSYEMGTLPFLIYSTYSPEDKNEQKMRNKEMGE